MTFRVFGSKLQSHHLRAAGHKLHSGNHRGSGSKHHNGGPGGGVFAVPHTTGLGSLPGGSYHSGNTRNAVGNGQNDRRPTDYHNAARAGRNQIERACKRQKGGMM
eukprot:jgi/Tetstr1/435449/TSEL_024355.t1